MKTPPLEKELLRVVAATGPSAPLPPVRLLGKRLDVSYTTVFRALQRLTLDGRVWQHPTNGRFYSSAAKAVVDRPKPVACLTRRLELCSALYRELLEGISRGCGAGQRTMLLWHDDLLVNHHDPQEPPEFADPKQQRRILDTFLARHGDAAGGFVFDHVWSDEVLAERVDELGPSVVLLRRSALAAVSNPHLDHATRALQALAHLLAKGFERIVPVEPFRGDPAIAEFLATLESAARTLGCADRLAARASAATVRQRQALVANLRGAGCRVALLCPEDNIARALLDELRAARISCPKQMGVLSVMGTDVASQAGLTCVRYDFRAVGRLAIELLDAQTPVRKAFEPTLVTGATT